MEPSLAYRRNPVLLFGRSESEARLIRTSVPSTLTGGAVGQSMFVCGN